MDVVELLKIFAGPTATIIAAGAALRITWVFNSRQLRIAESQLAIAEAQKRIATERVKLDLYEKRFKVFDAARQFLIDVVQSEHVDAGRVIEFNVATADVVFLFENEVERYLDGLRERILRLKRLKGQEKAADEYGEEEKRIKLGDLAANQHIELSKELPTLIETFKPYLKLRNI